MATFRAVMSHEPLQAPTLLGYLWRVRRVLAPGVGLALLRSLAIAPCPLIFAHIIDRSVPAGDTRDVLLATAVFAALLGHRPADRGQRIGFPMFFEHVEF
jgi:hypothetical protein